MGSAGSALRLRGQLQVAVAVHKVSGPNYFLRAVTPISIRISIEVEVQISTTSDDGSSVAACSVFLRVVLFYGVYLCP